MTNEVNDFQNFTRLALRTESKINNANIDLHKFKLLLEMYITIGNFLDYMKKGIYYNNYSKYETNEVELSNKLNDLLSDFLVVENNRENVNNFNFRVMHGLLGALTESSEIAEHLLKYLETEQIDKIGVSEEFSDFDWYKAITFDEMQLDENQSRQNVIDKLRIRYPDKYDDSKAEKRDLKAERKELEKN